MTTTFDAPTIPGFQLGHPEITPRFQFSATMPTANLTERHRPTTLSEVVGQGAAVFALQTFLDAPYTRAFLFEGPTGVGKTSAALALANDLGVDPDWGFEDIKSARADMDSVDRALRMLRHVAPGSGWKLVLVDEADLMTPKAAHLFLSALEDLPPKSVIVFTTNAPERFPDRFLDRCERISFASDARGLAQDAQALVDSIWEKETGMKDAPSVDQIPNLVDRNGSISFRRAVDALDPLLRAKRRPAMPDGRPVVAFSAMPPADVPPAPVAAPATKPDRPARTIAPDAPGGLGTRPKPESRDLTRLRVLMNELIEEEDRIGDLCVVTLDAYEAIKAEIKAAPRGLRPAMQARLDAGDAERLRVGRMAMDIQERLKMTRAAIKRAERDSASSRSGHAASTN